jgi:thioester reductase-like protein
LESGHFERLAEIIDCVVHNGAWVSAAHTYQTLRRANVEGTRELLKLASVGNPKPIHYVSTLNTVLTPARYPDPGEDEECLEFFKSLPTGYAQSKWVAEMLLQAAAARGLTTRTYRAPLIGAARCTGISNSNDLLSRLIDRCVEVGCFPEIMSEVNMIAVDDLSDRFVALALNGATAPRYNILNEEELSIGRLVGRLEQLTESGLDRVSNAEWLRRCGQSADGDLLSMTMRSAAGTPVVSDWAASARECDEQAKLETMHSPLDDDYLDRYLLRRIENVGESNRRRTTER